MSLDMIISNSCAVPWDLLDLLPFLENHRISWFKFLNSLMYLSRIWILILPVLSLKINSNSGLSSEACGGRNLPSTYFSVLTWVQFSIL